MGLAGYIIGGALSGIGKGMELDQRSRDEDRRAELAERRAQAMENLRSQNMANREEASDKRREDADARNDQREHNLQISRDDRSFGRQAALASAGAKANSEEKQKDREHEVRMARINGAIDTNRTVAEIAARAEAEGKQIYDVRPDANGNPVVYYKGGKREHVKNVTEPLKATTSSPDWLNQGAGQGPVSPVAKPIQIGRDKDGNLIWPE